MDRWGEVWVLVVGMGCVVTEVKRGRIGRRVVSPFFPFRCSHGSSLFHLPLSGAHAHPPTPISPRKERLWVKGGKGEKTRIPNK